MIIFHEGMPRSGKSYSAIKDHIIPAVAKGRKCYVRIDGINVAKIAELAGRTVDEAKALLVELTEEQCHKLDQQEFEKDSFIFIDEAQNYWPRVRKPLEPDMMKWIAEHGHHGHDVLLMGQLAKDVHTAWINRVNRKLQFIKKDVVGKDGEYKWIMFHGSPDASGNVKFREVSKGDGTYEERYFGTYKSHSEGTENKENYSDDRANIFKSAIFRKWLPLYGAVAVVALGYVVYVFQGNGLVKEEKTAKAPAQGQPVAPKVQPGEKPQQPPSLFGGASPGQSQASGNLIGTRPEMLPANQVQPLYQADYIEQLTNKYRIRLAGLVRGAKRTLAVLEWRDEADGIKESITHETVMGFGWMLLISPDGSVATLQKGDRRYVVTQWPLQDGKGRLSQNQNDQVKAAAGAPAPSAARADAPPAVVNTGNDSTNPKYNVAMRGQ